MKKKPKKKLKNKSRITQIQQALKNIPFAFTIFFSDEKGESVKYVH